MNASSVLAVPYATLFNAKIIVSLSNKPYLAVDQHFFQFCMRSIIEKIKVDEAWYLNRYPDVADASASNEDNALSAAEHYVKHGYFENRLPYEIKVEETWYLEQYPDVSAAVDRGEFASAQAHFEEIGYAEGRFAYPNFSLLTIPIAVENEKTGGQKANGAMLYREDVSEGINLEPSVDKGESASTTI
jgi:hypothetical protein